MYDVACRDMRHAPLLVNCFMHLKASVTALATKSIS
jgi:hypothetical protein